ncbi:MAG: fumarylacetoacetase, partial [Hyphomicrobiales bacterium]|nr:fumarylacetoacetase [Hyphomicrobiales bacterium]
LERSGHLKAADSPVFSSGSLNQFIAAGKPAWSKARGAVSSLLRHDNPILRDDEALRAKALWPRSVVCMHPPVQIGGYTDFYSSREHATNVGRMFRGEANALMPNWLYMPIGYNGRASTVVVDGTPVQRPLGQIKPQNADGPVFAASEKFDFELEIGFIVGRPSSMGEFLSVEKAQDAIFGFVLLNDWSARDIQAWEYQPLGPFQSKATATTISAWVVLAEALEPFRIDGPRQDPKPFPYLRQRGPHNYDIRLEVALRPRGSDEATTIARTNFGYMYWSSAQQLAHHSICGCAMNVGDLLGSGTISGPEESQYGSLLELTWNGAQPLQLGGGVKRAFLEDGDTLEIHGFCQGAGYRIGFGGCSGTVLPAAMLASARSAAPSVVL